MCELVLSKDSLKNIKKLDNKTKSRINSALNKLAENPFDERHEIGKLNRFKAFQGHQNRFRLRVGEMRVIYQLEHDNTRIMVLEVNHRGNVCKYK